jgi:hypothetical protein
LLVVAVRLEIELTSSRDDGTWTWRAAGARQPRGVLDAGVLPAGAKVGDVLRVDAEQNIDGINVTNVLPPKAKSREPERLEMISRPVEGPLVSSTVTGRDKPEGRRRPPRGDRPPRTGDDRDRPGRGERGRDTREGREPRERREPRGAAARPTGPRSGRPASEERPARPRPKRLQAGRAHRDALMATLPPEQAAVAEQLLKGGIPAVRQALQAQNDEAKAAGGPQINADLLVGMAEELLPRLRAAEWRDKAEAAMAQADEVGLRDLRSVVAGADTVARDPDSRELASKLRDALERRSAAERDAWVAEVTAALDDGRVVRALRISGRPPEAGARLSPEAGTRLSDAAGAALGPDAAPDRWAAVLDAVAASPVRATVTPAGLPPEPGDGLLGAARAAAGKIPALGALLGVEAKPLPPRPPRPPKPKSVPPPPPPAPPAPAPPPPPPPATEATEASEPTEPSAPGGASAESPAEPQTEPESA